MITGLLNVVTAISLVAAFSGAPIQGQGKISGVARDSSGAGVPGVTVTATNQATKDSQNATTNGDGSYTFTLPPGSYTIAATLSGFRRVIQSSNLTAGGASQVDFTLQPLLTEEITVTATKREQALIDVPFSVAARTEETLRSRGVQDMEGVAANVGGLTVQNLGPGQSQVAVRGVSAGQIVRDQPGVKEQVGIYLDESVISLSLFTPDLDLFDTNRIEVLRGPQGTLFGSGSLSGTVRYITNQPEVGVTRGFAELGVSGVAGGNAGADLKLGFNVPVGKNNAARITGYHDRLAGYIDAVQPDGSVKKNVNDGFRSGFRGAVKFVPREGFSIQPRLVYQRVKMNGWNRTDSYNILANPFTTTRPPVTLNGREQFTQLEETFRDDFLLGDLNLTYAMGDTAVTSVTSFTHRDVDVIRDATALTASITGGSIGLPQNVYTLDAPLDDATKANVFTQELRFSKAKGRVPWVFGGFYSHGDRDYGQNLLVAGFQDLTGIPTVGLRAPKDVLFFSDLGYKLNQFALFGEATISPTDRFSLTAGLRYYHFSEDKEQIFDGLFANDNTGTALVSQPGTTDADDVAPRVIATFKLRDGTNLNAQVSKGFRLGGINDPLNVPLCTPADLATFGGRDQWTDETAWNYEGGVKSRVWGGRGAVGVSAFYMDIRDLQATVTAGSCSSRVVFNVPKARSQGLEVEFEAAPTRHVDFAVSTSFNDAQLRSDVPPVDVTGIASGDRLPTVPKFQLATAGTYQWEVKPGALAYLTGTYQHIGSRYTQVGDQLLGTLDLASFGGNTIGAPLTARTFTYDPKLPAYDLLNLRAGVRRGIWDIAVFMNNVTDEHALLSFDRERGTRARIGYLTNTPRSFGVSSRFDF